MMIGAYTDVERQPNGARSGNSGRFRMTSPVALTRIEQSPIGLLPVAHQQGIQPYPFAAYPLPPNGETLDVRAELPRVGRPAPGNSRHFRRSPTTATAKK
jgi:hypothetical protein